METVADRLKELRASLGYSMSKMGEKLGISRDTWANIEYKRTEPKPVLVKHVAEVFGLNEEYLMAGKGELAVGGMSLAAMQEFIANYQSLTPPLRELADSYLDELVNLMNLTTSTLSDVDVNLQKYLDDFSGNQEIARATFLKNLIQESHLSVNSVSRLSTINQAYIYKAISGEKLERNQVMKIGIALKLDSVVLQQFLLLNDAQSLNLNVSRDAIFLYLLNDNRTVPQVNLYLFDLGIETI